MNKLLMTGERLFFRAPNINVCFRVELEGSFTGEQAEGALEMLCRRHPLLKCTVQIDENNRAWYIPGAGKLGVEFHGAELDWQDWYEKTDSLPFDFAHGPLVKICVIRNAGKTELLLLGHHIIADGIGYLNLTRDLLLALDGSLDTTPQPLQPRENFRQGARLGFLPKIVARQLNKQWALDPRAFSEAEYRALFESHRRRFPPGMYHDCIEGAALTELLSSCKRAGITVNEAITMAFAAAMLSLGGRYSADSIPVGLSVNVRNDLRASAAHCLGDYVAGFLVKAAYDGARDFISNAKRLAPALRKVLHHPRPRLRSVLFVEALDPALIESTQFASYGDYGNGVSKKLAAIIGSLSDHRGLGVSNLGKPAFDQYRSFTLRELRFIPPVFPHSLVIVGVVTANNKLAITLRYAKSEITMDAAEALCAAAKKLLLP